MFPVAGDASPGVASASASTAPRHRRPTASIFRLESIKSQGPWGEDQRSGYGLAGAAEEMAGFVGIKGLHAVPKGITINPRCRGPWR